MAPFTPSLATNLPLGSLARIMFFEFLLKEAADLLNETFFWMDLDFFVAPPGDTFMALIFNENLGFEDFILDAEETNPSLLVTTALFMDRLAPEALLLASEALLLASEALLLASEALLLASEAFLLESEAFLLASEALLLEAEAFLLESETFLLASEAFLLEAEAFRLESETFLLEAEAFLLESETVLLEAEVPLLEAEVILLDSEVPRLEPDELFLEAESKAILFILGEEDIFSAFTGTRFPFVMMNGFSGFDLARLAVILFEGLFFFESILEFADTLFGVLRLLETFFFILVGEEEDFLDFLFRLEEEALLMSSSSSLLTSRCILLDLDLTMFVLIHSRCVALIDWCKFGKHVNLYCAVNIFFFV